MKGDYYLYFNSDSVKLTAVAIWDLSVDDASTPPGMHATCHFQWQSVYPDAQECSTEYAVV